MSGRRPPRHPRCGQRVLKAGLQVLRQAAGLALLLVASVPLTAAALELNTASQADLESFAGIGTTLSTRLLTERSNAPFRDWPDALARVRGLAPTSAARLSAQGLRIGGAAFTHAGPAPAEPAAAPVGTAPPSAAASASRRVPPASAPQR